LSARTCGRYEDFLVLGDANEDPHPALRATLSRCDGRGPEELVVDLGEVMLA
jgi:hypothetical protein